MANWRYVPNDLQNAVNKQGSFTNRLSGQASRLNSQAGYFNDLSGKFVDYSDAINDMAIGNLLKYGEVSENDLLDRASADNALAYSKSYDAAQRNLSRMGINPNSGRFAGANLDMALTRAAAEAGARNQARIQARNENFTRAGSLSGVGKGYAGLGLQAASGASGALGSAANIYSAAANNADLNVSNQNGMLSMNQGFADREAIAALGDGNYHVGLERIKEYSK